MVYITSTRSSTAEDVRQSYSSAFFPDTQAVVLRRPRGQGRKSIRKNRLFSLFLFLRLLRFSPVDSRRALDQVGDLFWSTEVDETEPVGRVGSSATQEKHFLWFARTRMSELRAPELDPQRLF